MGRAVALLRAVNVGGRTATKAQLTAGLQSVGLTGVSTFLASGNVLFDLPSGGGSSGPTGLNAAPAGPWSDEQRAALQTRIEGGLQAGLGFPVEAFVRTAAELTDLAARDAFPDADPAVSRQVAFLKTPPSPAARRAVASLSTDRDTLAMTDREVCWLAADGVGRSALKPGVLDRTVGQPVTVRSRTTVVRLAALLQT